jgi:hypothetical protein
MKFSATARLPRASGSTARMASASFSQFHLYGVQHQQGKQQQLAVSSSSSQVRTRNTAGGSEHVAPAPTGAMKSKGH